MKDKTFLINYKDFVDEVTSTESKNLNYFIRRLKELDAEVNVPRLLTGASGLSSEGGEFNEIVKKVLFQGKPLDEDTKFHMTRELGDIMWYWMQACMAMELDPYEVIEENINKLQSRYPGGKFDAWYSENRKANDL